MAHSKNIFMEERLLVSECCGEEDRLITPDGPLYSERGMCPKCRDWCYWLDETEEQKIEILTGKKYDNE